MALSKPLKLIIGLFTIAQLFVGLFFILWIFSTIVPLAIAGNEQAVESIIIGSLGGIFFWTFITIVVSLGLTVFYIVHAATNGHLSTAMKIVWIILVFFFGAIAEVIYFFMEIIPEKSMTARLDQV